MNDQMTKRHQRCWQLYHAGMQWDTAEVKRLLRQIDNIDRELAVPNFELPVDVPRVGDLIYLPTRGSIGHGYDDVKGGVGVVKEVEEGISAGLPAWFVTAHEHPGRSYNWEFLGPEQAEMQKLYGDGWACPDPDLG